MWIGKQKTAASLDIGSSKLCAAIGALNEYGQVEALGVGTAPAVGFNKGLVTELDAAQESVLKALEEAEAQSSQRAGSVFVGIGGAHIKCIPARGVAIISDKSAEINASDIERVKESARNIAMPFDREVIESHTLDFIVDGQTGIKDPLGMYSRRLEAEIRFVTIPAAALQNIAKVISAAGLEAEGLSYSGISTSQNVLTDEERELGVILLDLGASFIDAVVYKGGKLEYMNVWSVGCDSLTEVICKKTKVSFKEAEEMKRRFGLIMDKTSAPSSERLLVKTAKGTVPLYRHDLSVMLDTSMREMLMPIKEKLEKLGLLNRSICGVVVTGGGSLLEGAVEMIEEAFGLRARLGYSKGASGQTNIITSPVYASAIGLLKSAFAKRNDPKVAIKTAFGNNILTKAILKAKAIYSDYF